MKAGDRIVCPHCRQETFAKEHVVMADWTVKEKILQCPLCGARLPVVETTAPPPAEEKKAASLDALSQLLGGEKLERPDYTIAADVKRFCKDCRHFIAHPFRTRCAHWDREVDPMDDCECYQPKTAAAAVGNKDKNNDQ